MATASIPFRRRHAIYVQKLRRNRTAAEHEFCCYLDSVGVAYRFQQTFAYPAYRVADFFIPALNIIVEIDGPCHDPEEDRRKDAIFERMRGIRVLRFTNEQVMAGDVENLYGILYDRSGKRSISAL
jgi:very-short-patch-repair endonuclease